jgi:hypothetical protein
MLSLSTATKEDEAMQTGQLISVEHNGYRLDAEIVEVRPKAVKLRTLNTAGEWKQYQTTIWLPIKAIVARPLPKDPATRAYYIEHRMNEGRFVLAPWFAPDENQRRVFRNAEPVSMAA